ncbi:hypothetical protein GCM10020331_047320 [Ectobacillus funiculus]
MYASWKKIIKALSGFYYVAHEEGITQCRGRGVFRKNKVNPLVGDEVVFQAENNTDGYILEVLERKMSSSDRQLQTLIKLFLYFSAVEPGFSSLLLDRFLMLIEYNAITPIICISKNGFSG